MRENISELLGIMVLKNKSLTVGDVSNEDPKLVVNHE